MLNNLTDGENYVANSAMNFDSDWDAFIDNIHSTMDVQSICDTYQAAYDRMVEKTQK